MLSSWKARHLSLGGRITLIQSALANLPIYYMSIIKCPIAIINRIEKLQRDFLWHGREDSKKIHLVNWKLVCSPKDSGGLGLRPLRNMNQALLGKWLWRLGEDSYGLWRSILIAKYRVRRNGWDTLLPKVALPYGKGYAPLKLSSINPFASVLAMGR
ncbi:hypothetical protein AAC387_Pa04g1283 [Persea americana]